MSSADSRRRETNWRMIAVALGGLTIVLAAMQQLDLFKDTNHTSTGGTNQDNVCWVCGGDGTCNTCSGTGVSPFSRSGIPCSACGGSRMCSFCGGDGHF